MAGTLEPDWRVQYRKDEAEHFRLFLTPEEAIDAACVLIDNGGDVYGIGSGSLDNLITKDQISRIYAIWARAKPRSR